MHLLNEFVALGRPSSHSVFLSTTLFIRTSTSSHVYSSVRGTQVQTENRVSVMAGTDGQCFCIQN